MALGGTYSTGTIAVTADTTAVVGTGTLWSAIVEVGDWLYANGAFGLVNTVTNDTNIVLDLPWKGGTLSGSVYRIVKMSWLRYEPALTQQKLRAFLAVLGDPSIFYQVTGAAPDVGLGEDGQYALKVNSGPWTLWLKVAGVWVLQGSPVGFNVPAGAYDNAYTYALGDTATLSGKLYYSLQAANVGHSPLSSPTWWRILVENGDVYDVGGFSPDRPGSGENILSWLMNRAVTFPAGLTDSQAKAGTAATAQAVFSIQKNGVEFGTVTIAAAGTAGTFASASGAVFAAGDVLDVVGPSPRDATLADMHVTLFGYR